MKRKIIITETQYGRLKQHLEESTVHSNMVKRMKEELDANYAPVEKFMREGGEYFSEPMIMVKADEEVITPKSLFEYLKFKYKMGDDFIKQVVRDWVDKKITDDYRLSKNVPLK